MKVDPLEGALRLGALRLIEKKLEVAEKALQLYADKSNWEYREIYRVHNTNYKISFEPACVVRPHKANPSWGTAKSNGWVIAARALKALRS